MHSAKRSAKPAKKSPPPKKTIRWSDLRRLSFANSRDLPPVVNINGKRHRWVGIGWVDEGNLEGDEVEVID
jgi:hypothetical protein